MFIMKLCVLFAILFMCCYNTRGNILPGHRSKYHRGIIYTGNRGDGRGFVTGHRARRADDRNPLEAVVMQQSTELNQLKAKLTGLQTKVETLDRRVAFLVQIVTEQGRVMPKEVPYKFDRIVLNDGNGYDATLGVFTAPYAGVYVFAFQVFTNKAERPLVDIIVNGNALSRMAVDASVESMSAQSASTTAVVKLQAQDRVWAQGAGDFIYWGNSHTFFTGALLYTV